MIINNIKDDFYNQIIQERVLVLVNTSVDALCAWKILQSLLHLDSVQYTLVPVNGRAQLEEAYTVHSAQNNTIVLIDCGANLNLTEILEPQEETQIFIIDSHMPYDLDNVYDGGTIKIVVTDEVELEVPRFEDIFQDSDAEDDADEPESKKRREDEDDETSVLPKKERWRRKREELLYTYYELSGFGQTVALSMFNLAWKMSKDNNQSLWWAIIGMTDQLLHHKISRDQYVTCFAQVQQHVSRLNNYTDTSNVSINNMKLKYSNELRLDLYRHWSLMESLQHSIYTAARFRIWTTKGKKKLTEFLADMGLPLSQCKQRFSSMDMDIRKEVCGWIEVTAQRYGLEEISYSSFELQYGFKNKFCAADLMYAVFSILTQPDTTGKTHAAFLKAQDTLNRNSEALLHEGIESSKLLLGALLQQVQAFIDMKQVVCTGPFVYAVVQEGATDLHLFSNPSALLKLCHFLTEAYVATTRKAATLPFILAAPCLNQIDESIVVGVPPIAADSQNSYLGRAFKQAADRVDARVEFDDFNPSVMQIKSEDKAKFFDALTALLTT